MNVFSFTVTLIVAGLIAAAIRSFATASSLSINFADVSVTAAVPAAFAVNATV